MLSMLLILLDQREVGEVKPIIVRFLTVLIECLRLSVSLPVCHAENEL